MDIILNENELSRFLEYHSPNGFAIISASRHENTSKINKEKTNELKNILKKSQFSYKFVIGGYKEDVLENDKPTGKKRTVKEDSFIIYNKTKNGEIPKKNKLFKFALNLCNKFEQDSILYSENGDKPRYYKQNGEIDSSFNNKKYTINDVNAEYFTQFDHKKSIKIPRQRFTLNYEEPDDNFTFMQDRAKDILSRKKIFNY